MERTNGPPGGSSFDRRAPLLTSLARRVKALRERHRWTQAELARRSGISPRFLARIEGGDGNISVLRLDALARALGTTPDLLVRPPARRQEIVTLVGLRGAGKSTVGPILAERLGCAFVEMDALITEESGLSLDQLFEMHGERYYRRLEHDTVLSILSRGVPAVVAAAGGVVTEPATWRLLRERTTVVWLRATAEDHWSRVVAQGDRRPMADNPRAMEELRAMLAEREPLYSMASLVGETNKRAAGDVAVELETQLSRLTDAPVDGW